METLPKREGALLQQKKTSPRDTPANKNQETPPPNRANHAAGEQKTLTYQHYGKKKMFPLPFLTQGKGRGRIFAKKREKKADSLQGARNLRERGKGWR